LGGTLGCRQVTHLISYNNTFIASLYIPKQNVICYLKPKEGIHLKLCPCCEKTRPFSPSERWPKCLSTLPAVGSGSQPLLSPLRNLKWCYAILWNNLQSSYLRRWHVPKSELTCWSSPSNFSLPNSSRNILSILRNVAEWPIYCNIPMHRHTQLHGLSSYIRHKRIISKQIIVLNTRNNYFNPSITCPRSLSLNVTLLVWPGIEPKITRFGGNDGVSCGQGLYPRHGPLQCLAARNHVHSHCLLYFSF
jgi:hypothetical protein